MSAEDTGHDGRRAESDADRDPAERRVFSRKGVHTAGTEMELEHIRRMAHEKPGEGEKGSAGDGRDHGAVQSCAEQGTSNLTIRIKASQ